MGAWLSTDSTLGRGEDDINRECVRSAKLQAVVDVTDKGTQTPVAFSDRLTNFGAQETVSTDSFEHTCDLCDAGETEAVGFCRQCEQFCCLNCCRCHEKWAFSQSHEIVGKSEFDKAADVARLFEKDIVPVSAKPLPLSAYNSHVQSHGVCCLAYLHLSGNIVVLEKFYTRSYLSKHFLNGGENFTSQAIKGGLYMILSDIENDVHMIIGSSSAKTEILLTAPSRQSVLKCSLGDKRAPVKLFKTSGQCWGLAEFDDGFAVSVKIESGYAFPSWQIQYLDYDGNIKRQLCYNNHKKALFSNPKYLETNSSRDTLYVSDAGRHAIIALNAMADVLFIFSRDDLKYPTALTADGEDNLYVACGNKVIQIHKSGTKHRVLIEKTADNLRILSVCFHKVSQSLVVGEESRNIKIFKFLP